jgi:hypothetical protein
MSNMIDCSIHPNYKLMTDADAKGNHYNYLFIYGDIKREISAYTAREANEEAMELLYKIQNGKRI